MFYKLVICGERVFQEIELTDKTDSFLIGTGKECKVQINEALMGIDFQIGIYKDEKGWKIKGSDLVVLKDSRQSIVDDCYLSVDDRIIVNEKDNDREILRLDFYPFFPVKNSDYDMKIDFSRVNEFTIGGQNCNIQICDPDVFSDVIYVSRTVGGLHMELSNCRFGITVNAVPCQSRSVEVKNKDFFALRGYQFFVFNGNIYTCSDGSVVTNIPHMKVEYQKNHFSYPKFIKNTRQQYVIPSDKIEVLAPQALGEPPERNLLQSMIPALMSVVLIVLFRGVMSGKSGGAMGSSFMFYSVGMMFVGIIGSIFSYTHENKKYKKKKEEREKIYRQYLDGQESKIVELRNKEHAIACMQNSTVLEDVDKVANFDSRLFEKKKEHEDYLFVNLGKGIVKTQCPVEYKEQDFMNTDDYLMEYPKSIHDKYRYIEDMPVMLDLNSANAVGFVGTRGKLYQLAKNLIINIATEHFYQDVKMFYIIDECDIPHFDWARWFQNSYMGNCAIRNFMYDENSAKVVLEYLYEMLSSRDGMSDEDIKELPNMVVFVYRSKLISNHPIMQYVSKATKLGFTFIFFEEYPEMLNEHCEKRIFLNEKDNEGLVMDASDGEQVQKFVYQHVSKSVAEQVALKLACVYVDEFSLESNLTKNISLFELLKIRSVQELNLKTRWNNSKIYESMAAPLGVKSGDEVVTLDLHEKFHGPHGLVAGTTGSGKSEILQSYILSMATLFHPYEVGFIIIDFKGGGMANQFKDLPHLNGAITNIDGREIERSLLSIRAELNKRQQLFAKMQVNHIDEYIKAFKQGLTDVPLPHLILIVDEFAELKSEQPDFMKELISTARIGRSLGVHLILATQKPSGVVNDQIWSNSKFKLCLKVQNKQDSNEVLKSPLAAEIREPGRAYLQVGNNEIFQLFQSAYSGAPAKANVLGTQKKYKISKVMLSGQRQVIYEQKTISQEDSETQLEAIVNHVKDYFESENLRRLPDICLPPLEEKIYHTLEGFVKNEEAIEVPIGIYDDPNTQSQNVTSVNMTQSNLFLLGASQMGKTNMIQMMIKGIAELYGPDEVNFYILDFATMVLKNFESLAHVGGVVTAYEDEKVANLFKLLQKKISQRKDILSNLGLSSFAAYKEAGYKDLPQIIVVLDNVTAFKEMYQNYEEILGSICRDGVSVGISVIATNNTSGGMGLRFLTYFGTRVAFTCNTKSESSSLFDRCKIEPAELPGRAIIKLDKEFYECQTYLAFDGEREIDRTTAMKMFIEESNEKYENLAAAERIPYIPDLVTEKYINSNVKNNGVNYNIVSGFDFASTQPIRLALTEHPMIGLYGKSKFGKSNFVRYMLGTLERNKEAFPYEMYIADGLDKKYESYQNDPATVQYSFNPNDALAMVGAIYERLQHRYQQVLEGNEAYLDKEPMLIFVINSQEAYMAISRNPQSIEVFRNIVKTLKKMKVCILIPALENAPIGFTSCDVVKCFRDDKVLFIFDDVDEQKFFDVSLSVKRQYSKKVSEGECYMLVNNDLSKIKTPLFSKKVTK